MPSESPTDPTARTPAWWRDAVVYQVYIRSFADSDGDGVGDIGGIRARLPYLRDLGVDAIWINPWYPSPLVDGGYDVADYRDIDPTYGTLADAEALVAEAHEHGLRLLLDIVPNHTAHTHPWFAAALTAGPGSAERARYHFRDGQEGGSRPPNDWRSVFGGSAWTRIEEPDGTPGQWYLHLFAPEQPDLDWANADVRSEFEAILRFWFDRGVDGFRIDVAHGLAKAPGLPDVGYDPARDDPGEMLLASRRDGHPHWNLDAVHEIYRGWRAVADAYGDRAFVAEAWVPTPARLARYVGPEDLHTAFNFAFLNAPWDAAALRAVIDETTSALAAVGAPPTWVLSSHDATRHVTRYGRRDTSGSELPRAAHEPADSALGTRRARAAALLMLALPGGAYLYQGEELGLWQVEDLPRELLQDPAVRISGGAFPGRDGCRVPLPWSGVDAPFGFGPPGSEPWLPQPAAWRSYTAEAEAADPGSMLALYRDALAIRREHRGEALEWLESPPGVLHFDRGAGLRCAVNLSDRPFALPRGRAVLLASGPLEDGDLPPDTAVWLRPS